MQNDRRERLFHNRSYLVLPLREEGAHEVGRWVRVGLLSCLEQPFRQFDPPSKIAIIR